MTDIEWHITTFPITKFSKEFQDRDHSGCRSIKRLGVFLLPPLTGIQSTTGLPQHVPIHTPG